MSTQSNAANELPLEARATVQTVISPGRRFYWNVRRELWENRSIYLAPSAMAGFAILGVLIGVARGALHLNVAVTTNGIGMTVQRGVSTFYDATTAAIMVVALIVAAGYCLSTLQGERRDRSILFWKSLPVSDLTAVLAKTAIPFVILPAVMMALIVATNVVSSMILAAALLAHGQSAALAWPQPGLPQMWGMTLYHLVAIHVLWYAPLYCYMLMISAWSKRAPFLWVVVPPVAAGVVEKIAFGSSHIFSLLLDRLSGASSGAVDASGGMKLDSMHIAPLHFLATPGLWLGLVAAVIFLAAAVRLRREQAPV